jgi:hypothetical protein
MRPKPTTIAFAAAGWLLLFHVGAGAQDQDEPQQPATASTGQSICLMMESAAAANGLPLEFFARLIWRESNFRTNAVGPMTRSGQRAQGIAQFMPGTAAERGLLDPFDPVQALPKSAEFLRELLAEFGNLGLAAAAYNAGPQRVRDWLEGRRGLPGETLRYVEAITGHSAAEWSAAVATGKPPEDDRPPAKNPTCGQMMAMLRERPSLFIEQLQQHVNKSATSPWGVQVSAGFSREKTLVSYSTIECRHRANLAGLDPIILQTTLRSRGTRPFYQVRIGADTRDAANKLCGRLRADGAACMVLRNKGT